MAAVGLLAGVASYKMRFFDRVRIFRFYYGQEGV